MSLTNEILQGEEQEFIVVAHDVWDGKRKKILGITLFITDPETFETYGIPVGLTPPNGEKAIELCKDGLLTLEKYLIIIENLWRSVSDNCTTAKKAGRL
jgi:hypothetical protein